jgi:fructose/tagatose bisphosphate aldolase
MALVTGRSSVLDLYKEAAELRWVIPCFCTENLTTTEAVLAAAYDYGRLHGIGDLPITIAITNRYTHRSQTANYSNTGRHDIGLELFLSDIKILTGKGSPFEDLRVMTHLDHIQPDEDEILGGDLTRFSSIMFDASSLAFDENIRCTRAFVDGNGEQIVIEGACDEITATRNDETDDLATKEKAVEYIYKTGVDLLVANLGTEHRASIADLTYRGDRAREIKSEIGSKLVLHGCSSVPRDRLAKLFEDGICKVNIWTALERDSSPALFRNMLMHASKIVGKEYAHSLYDAGLLGKNAGTDSPASIDYFTTCYRQRIIFQEMKDIVRGYLTLWYTINR